MLITFDNNYGVLAAAGLACDVVIGNDSAVLSPKF
jgi:hypothetical protein